MKVLISAYACEPGAGSEPGAGWQWARAAANYNDVWLLTRTNNRSAIEDALRAEPGLRIRLICLDLPVWARWWKRGQRGVHLYYLLWQLLAWQAARRLHAKLHFDLAHHVTFAVDWMPAGVVWVRRLPAVWGPVGGATGMPWTLWRWLGVRGILQEAFRELVTRSMRHLFGFPTARRAALVVAQNDDVGRRFSRMGPIVVEPHVAVDHVPVRHQTRSSNSTKRALFVGRLVPLKGLRLAVSVLAEPLAADWHLAVYGDGPERKPAERLARRMGCIDRVVFHGARPRIEVLEAMSTADALLHPSMHEAGGWAVAEALSVGVAVICLKRGGPETLLRAGGGVPVAVERDVIGGLAAGLAGAPGIGFFPSWSSQRLPQLLDDWYRNLGRRASTSGRV